MTDLRVRAAAALLAGALLAGGCQQDTHGSAPGESAPAPAAQTIVFDMGHGEIFGPSDSSALGQSQALARMNAAGFGVTINPDTITEDDLIGASGLFIAGPMRPLLAEEYAAVNSFAKRGGVVVLTIHVPFPVMGVPQHWGLPVGGQVINSAAPLLDPNDPGVLSATQIADDPVTQGVSEVLVVSGWPVSATSRQARLIVSTASDTWIDSNGSSARDEGDGVGPFGMIGSAGVGRGRVIVVGDDAVFANIAIGEAGNARLLDNILALMKTGLES